MDLYEAGKARLFHGTALEGLGLPKSRFSGCLQERTWARPGFPGKASSRPSALLQEIAEPDMTELHSDTYAQALDAADPLRGLRDEFLIPQHDGREQAYFCGNRSEEHTSELQSLMRISYAVFCLKKQNTNKTT